jgi:O-antigen/teichoic acid export membrane protein
LLAFLGVPLFFGISAVAPEIVHLILGERWLEAETPLRLLAIGMSLRLLGIIIPSFLLGLGLVRASFYNTMFALLLFPISFVIAAPFGLLGVCIVWLIAYPLYYLNLLRSVSVAFKRPLTRLIAPVIRPAIGATLMWVGIEALRAIRPESAGWAEFASLVGVGFAIYAVFTLLACRDLIAELAALFRR